MMFKNVIQIDVRTLAAINPDMLIKITCEFIEKELSVAQATGTLISGSKVD